MVTEPKEGMLPVQLNTDCALLSVCTYNFSDVMVWVPRFFTTTEGMKLLPAQYSACPETVQLPLPGFRMVVSATSCVNRVTGVHAREFNSDDRQFVSMYSIRFTCSCVNME